MKKSKFFTFIFAMLPGAGQMYQGLMKRGVSLMLTFFGVISFAVLVNIPELCVILPVIWFYAFFDCMNRSACTIEELSVVEDKMIFNFKINDENLMEKYTSQKNVLLGTIVIFIGVMLLYNSIVRIYIWRLEKYLPGISTIAGKLPVLILSVVVMLIGIRLIKGPKTDKAGEKPYEQ